MLHDSHPSTGHRLFYSIIALLVLLLGLACYGWVSDLRGEAARARDALTMEQAKKDTPPPDPGIPLGEPTSVLPPLSALPDVVIGPAVKTACHRDADGQFNKACTVDEMLALLPPSCHGEASTTLLNNGWYEDDAAQVIKNNHLGPCTVMRGNHFGVK